MQRLRCVLLLLAILPCGCTGDMLYFSTHTKVGIGITGTGDQISEATFGYDRFEGTFIPLSRDTSGSLESHVPSVYSCAAIDNGWLSGVSIAHTFATGEAAEAAAAADGVNCGVVLRMADPNGKQDGTQPLLEDGGGKGDPE